MSHKILIVAPAQLRQGAVTTETINWIRAAGYSVAIDPLDDSSSDALQRLCRIFDGRPPDLLVVDAVQLPDLLMIRHIQSLLSRAWGDKLPQPPCLALVSNEHLTRSEWPALVDDFLVAPASPQEIVARLKLLLFRRHGLTTQDKVTIADVTINISLSQAFDASGKALTLTPREYDLLRFLSEHRGKFFSRSNLIDLVWGLKYDGGERTVDIHIRRLRAKLPALAGDLVETRRGMGYRIASNPASN